MSDNPQPEEQAEFSEPLDEFCAALSRRVNSPELIAVFHFREKVAGRMHDLPSAYRARFDGTAAAPVN